MKIILKYDDKKLHRGFVDIQKVNKIASANTLNTIAFLSRKNGIKNIQDNFILRNKFTENNIRVKKVNTNAELKDMQSEFGATERASYMRLQEEGGIKKPKRGNTLSIPQLPARGGSKRSLVNKNLYLKILNKNLVKGKMSKNISSKKSRTVARAFIAFKENKFLRYNNNIYRITSFTKTKNSISFKKVHLYNLSQKNPRIKSDPWMKPAIQRPTFDAQNIYNSQINKLLRQKEII